MYRDIIPPPMYRDIIPLRLWLIFILIASSVSCRVSCRLGSCDFSPVRQTPPPDVMACCALLLPCAVLLPALLLVLGDGSCVPHALPDLVIDISQAVARGARFTDPLSVLSEEECLTACCAQQDMAVVVRTTTVKSIHSAAKEEKPDVKPENLKIYLPTAGTGPNRTSTAPPQPVPRTKPSAASQAAPPAKQPERDHSAPKKVSHPLPALTTERHTGPPQRATRPSPVRTPKPSNETMDQDKTPPTARPAPAVHLEEAGGVLPSLEDRSGLVAALVFGVLFLMVVIGLVSRKVSEVRRRHRYTKLDYLINGMYVDT
ncbi:hypothetical protein GDO81_025148 [Engystomops pustulosus]|uniref:MANSC domain-containing protein n=1 Tax=Engystomops pustulosus TaxID=76066 RepID=A0AAV6ZGD1_ENGPU|nr:hypothetical protein GDO81_025148 [Engystomops pustulosus]